MIIYSIGGVFSRKQTPPRWQRISDIIFTGAFASEMLVKLVALGFLYFMDSWNWLDALVVCEV